VSLGERRDLGLELVAHRSRDNAAVKQNRHQPLRAR